MFLFSKKGIRFKKYIPTELENISVSSECTDYICNSLSVPDLQTLVSNAKKYDVGGCEEMPVTDRLLRLPDKHPIIVAVDDGPDTATRSALLCKYLKEVISVAGWLERISGKRAIIFTDNINLKTYVRDRFSGVDIRAVSAKYPSRYFVQRKIEKIDAVVFDMIEALALFRANACNSSQDTVLLSLSRFGERLRFAEVPVGISAGELFDKILPNEKIVLNGVLSGEVVGNDRMLVPTDFSLTLVKDIKRQPVGCIGCGKCVAACPTGVMPNFVNEQYEKDDYRYDYGTKRCISCNACSYICPSAIPLSKRVGAVREVDCDE